MSKKSRIEYLLCTLCVFLTAFLIYGFLSTQQPYMKFGKAESFLFFGLMAGFGFSGLTSTIILSVLIFRKRGAVFKVICSLLWPIILGVCVSVGYVCYIPYQIYNIVKIINPPIE